MAFSIGQLSAATFKPLPLDKLHGTEPSGNKSGAIEELPDGYALNFASPGLITVLAEWILLERLCCPFLRFSLELSSANP